MLSVAAHLTGIRDPVPPGVRICYGSDLLGDLHDAQLGEFELCAGALTGHELVDSATLACAELFGMVGQIGVVSQPLRSTLQVNFLPSRCGFTAAEPQGVRGGHSQGRRQSLLTISKFLMH